MVGCGSSGDGADPATARARSAESLRVLDEAAGSIAFTADSGVMAETERSLASLNGSLSSPILLPEDLHFITPPADGEEAWSEEVRAFLEERVFTEASYEGDGVYRLRGEDFCPADELTGSPDPACVSRFDEAELRVRAVLAEDGLDVTLLVGPERAAPLTVELRPDRIAVVVDLAEAKEAAVHLASISGEELELPRVLEGVVAGELGKNGDADVTLSFSIREAVRVEGDLEEGGYAFSSEARDPLFSVRGEELARRLSIALDVGETRFSAPWSALADEGSLVSGLFSFEAKGLRGSVMLEEGASELAITDVSFGEGQSTVKLDDHVLYSLDLNADSGRSLDVTVVPDGGGEATFAFAPELDLQLGTHLQPLADAGEVVDSYLLDETYRIEIDGASPATVRPVPADPLTGEGGGLAVVTGRIRLSSSTGAEVLVPAGQCLVEDAITAGEHALLGSFASAACE